MTSTPSTSPAGRRPQLAQGAGPPGAGPPGTDTPSTDPPSVGPPSTEPDRGPARRARAQRRLAALARRATAGQPLRRTLVASIVALFVVVTVATTLATVLVTQESLERQLDAQVVQTAARAVDRWGHRRTPRGGDLATRPTDGPTTGQTPSGDAPPSGLGGNYLLLDVRRGDVRQFIVFTHEGSRATDEHELDDAQERLLEAPLGASPVTVDLGHDFGTYRVIRSETPDGEVLVSGIPTRAMDDTLRTIVLVTVAVGLLGIGALGLATAWLVRVNLRPLERVAGTAGRVSRLPLHEGKVLLAERVPTADTDTRTEVGQVGSALNELLDHVDSSLQARHASETQLRQFVADASHELRTPLATISGYAELSRRETSPVPEGTRHALSRIESEAARMARLVEDLLLLARLDAGRPLERAPVDLTRLVIDTVSDARAAGPDHRWKLDLPAEAVETTGDQSRLTQVVVNLLANARAHTPPRTTVTARVRAEGGNALIQVADDGPGISPDLLPRIFSRFARGDAARHRACGSTGLGLSIVQAVVTAHHGTVQVASTPGGTVFTVRLPLRLPERP